MYPPEKKLVVLSLKWNEEMSGKEKILLIDNLALKVLMFLKAGD